MISPQFKSIFEDFEDLVEDTPKEKLHIFLIHVDAHKKAFQLLLDRMKYFSADLTIEGRQLTHIENTIQTWLKEKE